MMDWIIPVRAWTCCVRLKNASDKIAGCIVPLPGDPQAAFPSLAGTHLLLLVVIMTYRKCLSRAEGPSSLALPLASSVQGLGIHITQTYRGEDAMDKWLYFWILRPPSQAWAGSSSTPPPRDHVL
ncbi:hypothetical protein BHM03_00047284 [Ensete ventricosum]|nr:hypothetical protein BHM03_00047284 [Ensete ventricosum]